MNVTYAMTSMGTKKLSGPVFTVFRNGHYFGDVYPSMTMRFPYDNRDDFHVVISYGEWPLPMTQMSCYVPPNKVTEYLEKAATLEVRPI